MAALDVENVVVAGLEATQNAVSASDTFRNDGKTVVRVENGSGSTLTVTITTPATVDGLAVADPTVSIPDGEYRFIGPFAPSTYNDTDDNVTLAFDETTSVTCEVLRVA